MGQYQSGAVYVHDVHVLINQIEFWLLTSMNLGPQWGGSMFWSCSCRRRCDSISSCSLYVFFFFILIACSFSRFKSSPSEHSTVTFLFINTAAYQSKCQRTRRWIYAHQNRDLMAPSNSHRDSIGMPPPTLQHRHFRRCSRKRWRSVCHRGCCQSWARHSPEQIVCKQFKMMKS